VFGAINAFPALFDLDRVEVLRGPQGTLFGAGAEGGVVRFISPEPDLNKTNAYAKADVASTDHGGQSYESGVAFGTPLIDDVLAFRASVSYRYDAGWVDRVGYTLSPNATVPNPTPVYNGDITEANANYWETTTVRAALKWKVSDSLEIMPSVYYQNLHINDTAAYWVSLSDPANQQYRNGNAATNPSHDPFTLSAIRIKWDLGFASLFSNTAYYDRNQNAVSDYSQYLRATWNYFGELANTYPQAGDHGYATFKDQQRNFYQEVRLSSSDAHAPLVWSGGLFFSHATENIPENIFDPTLDSEVLAFSGPNPPVPVCSTAFPCPGGLIYQGPVDSVVDKQIAAFGELSYKIADSLKATAGVRVSRLDYTGSTAETGPFLGATIITQSSGTENSVTPKAVLTWQPNSDNTLYANASKGYRPGGPNVNVGVICGGPLGLGAYGLSQVPSSYASDSLWSYELGSKNALFDHTLVIDTSIYYIDWSNIQQNVYLTVCGEQFTANLGKAKSEGGDIEVLYRPITQLTFDFTAAYTDARLTKTSCAGTLTYNGASDACIAPGLTARPVVTSGDALLGAPWSFTASSEYHFAEWAGRQPYFRVDLQHATAQKSLLAGQDPNNGLYDTTLPGLPVVNNLSARAGLRFSGIDVSLYGNNLTNAHPLEFESRDISGPSDTLYFGRGVRPLTVGVLATYRY
jgi:iron complex outermembrane recepter protein